MEVRQMRGVVAIGSGRLAAAALAFLCLAHACNVPEPDAPGTEPAAESIVEAPIAGPGESESGDRVLQIFEPGLMTAGREGVRYESETTLSLEPVGEGIVLKDRRSLVRGSSGDFDIEIVRDHEGSEAGDTGLAIRATRLGADYWTRGTAGPFVHWDDARDEPVLMEASAVGTTVDLLVLALRCGGLRQEGAGWIVDVSTPCRPPEERNRTRYVTEALRLSGRVSPNPVGGYDADIEGQLGGRVGSRSGEARLVHRARVEDLGSAPEIKAPEGAISSRRDRPVRRVRSVLKGWEDSLGPGFPGGNGPVR